MKIDHITLAVPDLRRAQEDLSNAGLPTEYGGVHSTRKTHMSTCGFSDGSYLEIVSPFGSAQAVSLWQNHVFPPNGGTAWTIGVENVAEELRRAEGYGIAGHGPIEIRRKKPDGDEGRWELGYLGDGAPGAKLPFLIRDFTPRLIRIQPDLRFKNVLEGWSLVVLAVWDLKKSAQQFQDLYGWSDYVLEDGILAFKNTPVVLSSAPEYLETFGEAPCCGILGSANAESLSNVFRLGGSTTYLGRKVNWLKLPWPNFQIGIEVDQ